jgi:hypothetical protein
VLSWSLGGNELGGTLRTGGGQKGDRSIGREDPNRQREQGFRRAGIGNLLQPGRARRRPPAAHRSDMALSERRIASSDGDDAVVPSRVTDSGLPV